MRGLRDVRLQAGDAPPKQSNSNTYAEKFSASRGFYRLPPRAQTPPDTPLRAPPNPPPSGPIMDRFGIDSDSILDRFYNDSASILGVPWLPGSTLGRSRWNRTLELPPGDMMEGDGGGRDWRSILYTKTLPNPSPPIRNASEFHILAFLMNSLGPRHVPSGL